MPNFPILVVWRQLTSLTPYTFYGWAKCKMNNSVLDQSCPTLRVIYINKINRTPFLSPFTAFLGYVFFPFSPNVFFYYSRFPEVYLRTSPDNDSQQVSAACPQHGPLQSDPNWATFPMSWSTNPHIKTGQRSGEGVDRARLMEGGRNVGPLIDHQVLYCSQ